MIIPVVDVHGFKGDKTSIVYVGRYSPSNGGWPGHALCNPFKPKDYPKQNCVNLFTLWLKRHAKREEILTRLMGEVLATGTVRPLGCWCVNWDGTGEPPMVCHAVVLAVELQKLAASQGL